MMLEAAAYLNAARFTTTRAQDSHSTLVIDKEDTDNEANPTRIRRKLEVGLDTVLSEEGADPLKVADDQ